MYNKFVYKAPKEGAFFFVKTINFHTSLQKRKTWKKKKNKVNILKHHHMMKQIIWKFCFKFFESWLPTRIVIDRLFGGNQSSNEWEKKGFLSNNLWSRFSILFFIRSIANMVFMQLQCLVREPFFRSFLPC